MILNGSYVKTIIERVRASGDMRGACNCCTDIGCDELVFTPSIGRGIDLE